MRIAIHQPNFLPWLGYFYKMSHCDTFVLLDSVQFTKGGYTNRVKIKTPLGSQWLTVPIKSKGVMQKCIDDVEINDLIDTIDKISKALRMNYGKCPYYPYMDPILNMHISSGTVNLSEFNIRLIRWMATDLGILHTKLIRSSELEATGESTQLLVNICKELGADEYICGAGSDAYQDKLLFDRENIRVIKSEFVHPEYAQRFGDFIPGLSAIDTLFNCGGYPE